MRKHSHSPRETLVQDILDLASLSELASGITAANVITALETDWFPVNQQPYCEPQLGKRGLYEAMGGDNQSVERQMAMLWILNLADGDHALSDIADRSGIPMARIHEVAELLAQHDLISR